MSRPLVLGSASPRRRELLGALGVAFTVAPADVDERAIAAGQTPEAAVLAVAREKARVASEREPEAVVLAADTIVVLGGEAIGKPEDHGDARAMLRRLQGTEHEVLTAVCIRNADTELLEVAATLVRMRPCSDEEIGDYVTSVDVLDRAGAYGIQDAPFHPVESISGCYCNVMGLPLWTVATLLAQAGRPVQHEPDRAFARCVACPLALACSPE